MKKVKKIPSIAIILVLLYELIAPIVFAATTNPQKYLALGDSIAYGYGLSNINSQSYAQIVRAKSNISQNNFSNLAVSGMTCKEFYTKIQTSQYTKAIKSADIITISIGSNELLGIATSAISTVTGVSQKDPDFVKKVQQVFVEASGLKKLTLAYKLYSYFTSNETKATIEKNIASYNENWSKSVAYIKKTNPNAIIIATEFYNPYYEIGLSSYDLGSFVDEYICKMNDILKTSSQSETKYKIAKIYDDFNTTNPRITNVNIDFSDFSKINVDPHPNKDGHSIIASRVLDILKTSTVEKKNIQKLNFSKIGDITYTGSSLTPQLTIKDGNKLLKENTDYSLTYINNTNVGEASIIIKGIGLYTGTVTKTFNIKSPEIKKTDINKLSFTPVENQTYLGFKITPDVEIKDNNKALKKDTDYTLTYYNNIDVGEAYIDVNGIGNYTGTKKITFNILPKDISFTTISDITPVKHTGTPITPSIQITDGSSKLVLDKDYKINYSNNINIGTASIQITGIGNYTNSVIKEFQIEAQEKVITTKNISALNISDISNKTYTGKVITPEVLIYDDSTLLIKDIDYTLSYSNNLNIGTGNITITGIGNYTGLITKTFNIVQKDIQFTQIKDIENQEFTGNEISPLVTITSDHIKLIEGKDYTIEYTDNKEIGTAKIIITGINNYTGSVTKSFNIISIQKEDDTDKQNSITNNSNIVNATNNSTIDNAISDSTTAHTPLPFTGLKLFAIISIFIVLAFNIYYYKKIHFNKDI